MTETAWGGLFMVYVLAGLPLISRQASETDRPGFTATTQKLTWAWIAGLCLILLVWAIG